MLAVDASDSVSNDRFELQKQGYAAAFRNHQLLSSIRSLAAQSIAVTMMQWTGPQLHVQVVDWRLVKDEDSIKALVDAIEASQRQLFGGGTSISGAIDYARVLLAAGPFLGARRVIDVSGDGANNRGRAATLARDEAVRMASALTAPLRSSRASTVIIMKMSLADRALSCSRRRIMTLLPMRF